MRMKIDVTLDYALESPGPALLLIEAAGVHGQILNRTNIDLGQPLKLARVPAEEGIGERIVMRLQDRLTCRYSAEVQVTRPRPDLASLQAVEVEDMPGDALRYLLPSRYCQSERFGHFTGSRFEGLTGGPIDRHCQHALRCRHTCLSTVDSPICARKSVVPGAGGAPSRAKARAMNHE